MATDSYLKDAPAKSEQTSHGRLRNFLSSTSGLALIYFVAITIAESTTVLIEPRIGLILHGIVLIAILLHSALLSRGSQQNFLLSLILAPLVRLLSLSLPLTSFQFVYWYAIIGAPLLITAFLTARVIGLGRAQLGLTFKGLPLQLLFGLIGIGLGYLEYNILRPEPLTKGPSLGEIWLPALILLVFTGLLEEIIFRGVMYYVSLRSLGRFGIIYVSAIFAVLHLGYKSFTDVVFVFAVALIFGIITQLTGSIIGVTLAHGLTNIGLFLIFPFALGPGLANPKVPTPLPIIQTPTVTTTSFRSPTHTKQAVTGTEYLPKALWTITTTPAPHTPTSILITPTLRVTSTISVTPTPSPTLLSTPTPFQTSTPAPVEAITTTHIPIKTSQPTTTITIQPPQPTLPFSSTIQVPDTIIIDDGDIEFLRSGGEEYRSPQGYAGDFVWTTTTDGNAKVQIEWRPSLTRCGTYRVEVFIPSGINLTKSAFYQIGHRQGMSSRLINQAANLGSWVSLGEYELLPTSGTFLRLTNSTGEATRPDLAVIFDAAKWTLIASCIDNQQ